MRGAKISSSAQDRKDSRHYYSRYKGGKQMMYAILNLRFLLHLWVSFILITRASAETLTNPRTSFLQVKRWNLSETKGLGFRFKTFLANALLLYMDDVGQTNFLRVELFKGRILLTCSHGTRSGAMAVEVGENFNDLAWHQVLLEKDDGITTITVDNRWKSTIKSPEKTRLIIKSPMYFGGLTTKLSANRLTQPSVTLLNRFLGCITDIELFEYPAGRGPNRRKAIVENSGGIAAGCIDKCEKENNCLNNGTCLNRFITTKCDCTATGYRGSACEQALPVLGLSPSDYLVFNRSKKGISTRQDRIILRFKTANQNGPLLVSGRGRDYLAIELNHGSVLIRWNLGSGEIYVHVREKVISDDTWHSIDIRRDQRQLDLVIDGIFHVTRSFPGTFISFDLKQDEGDVLIGGMGTNGFSWNQRLPGIPFAGCFQEINFNNVDIIQELVNGKEGFTTQGHPRWSCEISQDLHPTTVTKPSSTLLVASEQATTATAMTSAKRVQPITSHKTTRMVATKDYTQVSALSFYGNSVIPCWDDDDDCRSEGSGSGENSGESGSVVEESGIFPAVSGDREIDENKITNNNSKNKFLNGLPSKAPEGETEGESDISQTPCVGDDEDACENGNESGQGSAEPGSTGESASLSSASPRPRTLPDDDGNNQVKRSVTVKHESSKKWTLIAGIIAVATVLVLFCIFAIWWLCKNKNNPQWTGMYNGSREACLQAENTDV